MPLQHPHFSCGRLRCLRESAGVTRTALAYHLGLTEQTVWAWESGKSVPRPSMLGAIAAVLGCAIDDLFEAMNDDAQAARPGRLGSVGRDAHARA